MGRLPIILSFLVVFGVVFTAVHGRTTTTSSPTHPTESSLSVVDRINLLDPEDRDAFIKVHLALGLNARSDDIPYSHDDPVVAVPQELDISEDKYVEIQEIEVPVEFSENLLDYTRSEFKLDYDDVHTLVLNSQVCFPGEVCTDVGDIGGACCPF